MILQIKKKRGRLIVKESYDKEGTIRTRWVSIASETFTKDRDSLSKLIPILE